MPKRLVIFDFDGTVAQTLEVGTGLYNAIAKERRLRQMLKKDISRVREMGGEEIIRFLDLSRWQVFFLGRKIQKLLRRQLPDIPCVEGIPEIVKQLHRKKNVRLALASHNSTENVKLFLQKNGMDVFDIIVTGSSIFGKKRLLKKILRKMRTPATQAICVGDELRDFAAARALGIDFIAVTTGVNTASAFRKACAPAVVQNSRQLLEQLAS